MAEPAPERGPVVFKKCVRVRRERTVHVTASDRHTLHECVQTARACRFRSARGGVRGALLFFGAAVSERPSRPSGQSPWGWPLGAGLGVCGLYAVLRPGAPALSAAPRGGGTANFPQGRSGRPPPCRARGSAQVCAMAPRCDDVHTSRLHSLPPVRALARSGGSERWPPGKSQGGNLGGRLVQLGDRFACCMAVATNCAFVLSLLSVWGPWISCRVVVARIPGARCAPKPKDTGVLQIVLVFVRLLYLFDTPALGGRRGVEQVNASGAGRSRKVTCWVNNCIFSAA